MNAVMFEAEVCEGAACRRLKPLLADAQVRQAGSRDVRGDQHARHRLRRRLKTLGYNTEMFQGLHDHAPDDVYVAALDDLHTCLGDMKDDAVGAKLLHALSSGPGAGGPPQSPRSRAKRLKT
ncbi:MAG: CHAD domain-containing protein, partial [Gemmatimonadaceae bacterium]|nr:CHAD domain-containing protein [Caulobacter sp.]